MTLVATRRRGVSLLQRTRRLSALGRTHRECMQSFNLRAFENISKTKAPNRWAAGAEVFLEVGTSDPNHAENRQGRQEKRKARRVAGL